VTVRRWLAGLLFASACASPPPHRPAPAIVPSPAPPGQGSRAPPPPARPPYGDDAPREGDAFDARAASALRAALARRASEPRRSGALDRAAAVLALGSARGEPSPLSRDRVQRALAAAAAFDPAPTVHLASGSPDEALSAILARVSAADVTHFGLADREASGAHHLVVLLAHRSARLDPVPSTVEPDTELRLSGALVGLLHPRVFVTRPDGSAEEIAAEGGGRFACAIRLASAGPYVVEVVGVGGAGPEVAALLTVVAGDGPLPSPAEPLAARAPEAEDRTGAEAAALAAIDGLRRARGLPVLTRDPALTEVARRHAERMLAAASVAHVLPGAGELADRLLAARVPFRRGFENVARGESGLAAHASIASSPAHRANLLAPTADRIGVGATVGSLPTGERVVYLTEILIESASDGAESPLTPDARVREALWAERARRRLPPLTNDLALEALARSAAAAMRSKDDGDPGELADAALRLGRRLAAADAFIATAPAEALRSRNLSDARFSRVGVGVAQGDSRRFGPGRLYVAVIYSD
jgi:uncharacterized protein YkwD